MNSRRPSVEYVTARALADSDSLADATPTLFPEFAALNRATTFTPGIGLPGRVWSSRQPACIPDVVKDANFPRAPVASREGLHSAFGFPLLLGDRVLGVMASRRRAEKASCS